MSMTSPPRAAGRWRTPIIAVAIVGVLASAGWMIWSAWRIGDLGARSRTAAVRADWDLAADLLNRLAWYRPADRDVLNSRIQTALRRDDPVGAAGLLAKVPSSAPDVVEARLTQGRLLMQAFRPREAESAFRDCLRLDPDADAARLALIAILAVQNRSRDYEAETWALLDRGGEPIKALRLLAQAAPAIPPDTFTRAADVHAVLLQCLAADADDVHTRLALAHLERGRGRIGEALDLLEPLLGDPSGNPEASVEWAACLLDEGDFDRPRSLFDQPPASARHLAEFWLLRGEWARRRGDFGEALNNFREAIRLDPRSPDAHYRIGRALRDSGSEAEASRFLGVAQKARELKDLVSLIPDRSNDPEQLTHIGRLCAEIGRDREARAWLALTLRTDPQNRGARTALGELDSERAPQSADSASVSAR